MGKRVLVLGDPISDHVFQFGTDPRFRSRRSALRFTLKPDCTRRNTVHYNDLWARILLTQTSSEANLSYVKGKGLPIQPALVLTTEYKVQPVEGYGGCTAAIEVC